MNFVTRDFFQVFSTPDVTRRRALGKVYKILLQLCNEQKTAPQNLGVSGETASEMTEVRDELKPAS
jgi:hypothetical protein